MNLYTKLFLSVLALRLISACSAAHAGSLPQPDDLTTEDYLRQVAVTAALYADYRQTEIIAHSPRDWHETNHLLGGHPSPAAVRNYFVGVAATSALVTYVLPEKYRWVFQSAEFGLEIAVVGHNHFIGLGGKF